jgi:hypothetical protein
MSTDWYPYCLTCHESYDMWNCHRPDFILYLFANAELIIKIGEFQEGSAVDIDVHTWYGDIHPEWFKKHLGHQLVPKNEYGNYLDSKGREVRIP